MEYNAEYDKLAKGMTIFIIIFTLSLMILITYMAILLENLPIVAIVIDALLIAIIIIPYFYAPKSYEIAENGVIIRRVANDIVIPYEKIKNFYVTDIGLKVVRLWASGGLYGYFGLFRVPKIGRVWAYLKRRRNVVLIEADKKYAVAPENVEIFIEELKAKLR
ncbi:MAG: PH domain-containing protein [Thermoplasmata archaeon]|nr:PH domain-containing protein [Thermoplasmata archaeon]